MTDPAKLREALDLASDASDEEVRTAVVAAGFSPAPPAPQAQADQGQPEDLDSLRKRAEKMGVRLVEADNYQEILARLDRQESYIAQVRAAERDKTIDEAIADGRIPPAKKAQWIANWDANPGGIKDLIAQLTPGLVPMAEQGYGTDLDGDDDNLLSGVPSEYAGLWPSYSGKGA